jgi:hypothetical protein
MEREITTVGQSFYVVPDFCVLDGGGKTNIALPYSDGGDDTFADESLTLSGVGFGAASSRIRVVARTPWSSWGGYSDGATVSGAKTIFRLYEDATNWIVAEWNGTLGGVKIRVNDGGTEKFLDLGADIRATREMLVDLVIARVGDDTVASVNIDGKLYSGTLVDGFLSISVVDTWKAGADEDDVITAWNIYAVETESDVASLGDATALLSTSPIPASGGGFRLSAWIDDEEELI